jgi:nicotinamidase/pyrazinamidase
MKMADSSSKPTLFTDQDVFKSAYRARVSKFADEGRRAGFTPAHEDGDREKIALILVDYQYDFVKQPDDLTVPGLYVPGSEDDINRLLMWFYNNSHKITSIYASLDTHLPFQIFFSSWWKHGKTGKPPEPFTVISEEEVLAGIWVPVSQNERGWSIHYVKELKRKQKKPLMIWPYHTMEGTMGHMLSAPISEAIAWHSAARKTQPYYIVKGKTVRSEYYGIFGPEVVDPHDAESGLNIALLDAIMENDKIYVAGEAKSHCVLESAKQLVNHFGRKPEILCKLHFLKDCTSSIKNPDPDTDFDAQAEEDLAKMVEKNKVQMVFSTDPVQ